MKETILETQLDFRDCYVFSDKKESILRKVIGCEKDSDH